MHEEGPRAAGPDPGGRRRRGASSTRASCRRSTSPTPPTWSACSASSRIGQGFVIITGGIELSVGSIIALLGVLFVDLIANYRRALAARASLLMLALGVLIGLAHGLLITRLNCSPSSSRCAAC